MTREEAIRELKADYCGNRIICELYPDQCNREDCEIWLAIRALVEQPIRVLETQPDGDVISRRVAIDAFWKLDTEIRPSAIDAILNMLKGLPSTQPEITPDGTLTVSINADIANVGRILLSQAGTQCGGLYYKDAEPEETCDTCKYGYFGDGMCDYCRVGYPSHYERRTDGRD